MLRLFRDKRALSYIIRLGQRSITSESAGTVIRGLAPTVKQLITVETLSSGTLIGTNDFWGSDARRLSYFEPITAFEPEVLADNDDWANYPLIIAQNFDHRISEISNVSMARDPCYTDQSNRTGIAFKCVPDRFSEGIPFAHTRMETTETGAQFTGYVLDQHGRLFVGKMKVSIAPQEPDPATDRPEQFGVLHASLCVNPQLLNDGFLCE